MVLPYSKYLIKIKCQALFFAFSIFFISSPIAAADLNETDSTELSKTTSASQDTGSLLKQVKAVLTRNYPGIDTAALIAQIQQKLQWSEKDERLIEAQGILHWDRGESYLALPCFIRLSRPSPLAMGLMAECLLIKGQQYEAAAWFLKAAQTYPKQDAAALPLYRRYLAIKKNQEKVELEFANRLEFHKEFGEAFDIYLKYENRIAKDSAATLRIGSLLSSQGREKQAIELYQLALEASPNSKIIWTRKAQSQEAENQRIGAAESWTKVWRIDPTDTVSRNRAISHLETSGSDGDSLLRDLVEKALEKDPASAVLHFKLAVMQLKANQKDSAYSHLEKALKFSPNNPTYLSKISEAIEADSLIKIYFPHLKSQSEKPGASMRLYLQVARGYSLSGDTVRACKTWTQAHTLSPQILDGRRDAFLDLASCTDPASASLALILGDKIISTEPNQDVLKAMSQVTLRTKSYAQAAKITSQLIRAFPIEVPAALSIAKAILAANDTVNAKTLFIAIVQQTPVPEAAFLLGKITFANKDYQPAAEYFAQASATYIEASKLRALSLIELKDLPGAASEYESLYTRTGDPKSLRSLARLYHEMGDAVLEKQALEKLSAISEVNENEKLSLGLLQISQGDTAKALVLLTALLRPRVVLPKDSLWAKASLFLGSQMLSEGKCEKGIKFISMSTVANPDFTSKSLTGQRDLFLKLATCNDPASQALAENLGDKLGAENKDREILRAQVKVNLRTKSFAKAATTAIKLITDFPDEALAGFETAKAILNSNKGQRGQANVDLKGLLTAIVTQIPMPEASLILGKILISEKNFEQASEQMALASSVYPDAIKMRADCLVALKDFQAAAAEYGSHYARTGDKESLRAQARLSQQAGNPQQERIALEAMAGKTQLGEEEKLRLGLLQAAHGDTVKALVTIADLFKNRNSISDDTLWSQAALILGNRMAQEGKCDRAIKLLTMGIKSAPAAQANRAEIWMQIGDCQVEKGRWKEAYAAYGQGISADPYSRNLARGRLQAAKKLGDKMELAIAYQAIYNLDPDDENANAYLGSIRQAEKEYKEAAVHFRRLADLHPTDGKVWENLGNALAMIPDLAAAAIPLQTAIDLGAESDEVYINRARAFRIEGAKDMAESILEFLLSRNANSYLAMLWTAKFAEEDGEAQKAMEMYKRVAKLSPPRTSWPELAEQSQQEAKVSESQ
jgi:tetratricopeptide (TPR) repeat protein